MCPFGLSFFVILDPGFRLVSMPLSLFSAQFVLLLPSFFFVFRLPSSSSFFLLLSSAATLGFLNPLLYSNPSALRDIVAGCNVGCGSSGLAFCAIPGWDPVTGIGSPNFAGLKTIV
eukprot:m.580332 g.580332  ORF g.580332 m.580332 type:complete len:116 (+) comp57927_c0_seq56:1591-1938(+)